MAIALFVPGGLGEDASQLDFARVGRLAVGLAFASLGLFLHHRHARPIHLHIQNGNRLTDDDGQIQLDGFADFALLACGDVGANRLRRALHRFGGHLQTGQNLHLLATVIEGSLLAHHRLHAAHPGREVRFLDVQFDVGRELAVMTVRAQIPGTLHSHPTHYGEHRPGAQFPVLRLMTTSAGQLTLIRGWGLELQQFAQSAGSGLMEDGPQGALDGLQIGAAAVSPLGENTLQ